MPELEYPRHFHLEQVYPNGVISFRNTQWYLSNCLAGQCVGLEAVADDQWTVSFGPIVLGVLDARRAASRGYRHFGRLIRADGTMTRRRRRRR